MGGQHAPLSKNAPHRNFLIAVALPQFDRVNVDEPPSADDRIGIKLQSWWSYFEAIGARSGVRASACRPIETRLLCTAMRWTARIYDSLFCSFSSSLVHRARDLSHGSTLPGD